MSGLGGLACMLPLRLGGDAESGLTASQHARICANAAAFVKQAPFALLVVGYNGDLESYRSIAGDGSPPGISASSGGVTLTWPTTWTDSAGDTRVTHIKSAIATPWVASGNASMRVTAEVTAPNVVYVEVIGVSFPSQCYAVVKVSGSDRDDAIISDYGGATDKRDCTTETYPYAEGIYQQLKADRGSFYSTARSGLVHVENAAIARAQAARIRDAERLATNSNPLTSGEKQDEWLQALRIKPFATDTADTLRNRIAARMLALRGTNDLFVEQGLELILGPIYQSISRDHTGDLSSPPARTFAVGLDTGDSDLDLGGGIWCSSRCELTVDVDLPGTLSEPEYYDRISAAREFLDFVLPATATYKFIRISDGAFILDQDQLDIDSIS